MNPDAAKNLVDCVEDCLDEWFRSTILWNHLAKETSLENDIWPDFIWQLDYIIQKIIPAKIEQAKFLALHKCDYKHNICIDCGMEKE